MKKLNKLVVAMAVVGMVSPLAAQATDGMFSPGYGVDANGMGGAATAMSEDAFGGANNPASMAFVGNQLDLGVYLFSPNRQASTGSDSQNSDSNYFLIPEIGYNHMVNDNLAVGVSVYGNGGMNTDYAVMPGSGGLNMLKGTGNLGLNLEQLIIAPTLAYKINANNSIGVAPLIGYERFSAQGLQSFQQFSQTPGAVTNNGTNSAYGTGLRLGYMGKITPNLSIGASYSTKISFDSLPGYAGLLAGGGNLDLPENYSLGVAYKVMPALTLAADYQVINYSGVSSIGNQESNSLSPGGPALGSAQGSGFGWQDVGVVKLGAEYQYNDRWILRAGYNHTQDPVTGSNVTFNIIAPGVVMDHFTMGASYLTATGGVWNVSYDHAYSNSVSGPFAFNPSNTAAISMYEDTLGVSYAWK